VRDLVTQILLIEKLGSSSGMSAFAARCHSGVLRVGDSLPIAVDPAGGRHSVEVRCAEIRLTNRIMVDELEANYGGMVMLEGVDASGLSSDWTLSSE
jgi:hypothetical protein